MTIPSRVSGMSRKSIFAVENLLYWLLIFAPVALLAQRAGIGGMQPRPFAGHQVGLDDLSQQGVTQLVAVLARHPDVAQDEVGERLDQRFGLRALHGEEADVVAAFDLAEIDRAELRGMNGFEKVLKKALEKFTKSLLKSEFQFLG